MIEQARARRVLHRYEMRIHTSARFACSSGDKTIWWWDATAIARKGEPASPAAVEAAVAKSLLANVPAEARRAILGTGAQLRLAPKDYFAHPGDAPRIGLVVKGMTRLGRPTQDGREMTVFWDRPGAVLGLGTTVRWPSASFIQAVTDTTILELSPSLFRQL